MSSLVDELIKREVDDDVARRRASRKIVRKRCKAIVGPYLRSKISDVKRQLVEEQVQENLQNIGMDVVGDEETPMSMESEAELPSEGKRKTPANGEIESDVRPKSRIRKLVPRLDLNKDEVAKRLLEQRTQEVARLRDLKTDSMGKAFKPTSPSKLIDWDDLKMQSILTREERKKQRKIARNASYRRTPVTREERKRTAAHLNDPLVPRPEAPRIKRQLSEILCHTDEAVEAASKRLARRSKSSAVHQPLSSGAGLSNLTVKAVGEKSDRNGSCSNTIMYWNDPNELVNRLRLLVASASAGHTGHNNEILAIIEELRHTNLIE
jgi:hypothetical protein